MYCSRRGREVSRPTDHCSRCGRCNWERQNQDPRKSKAGKKGILILLAIAAAVLLAAAWLLLNG